MKIQTYKSQTEVDKVFEVDEYDLMYGTVEDIFEILDTVGADAGNEELVKAISKNRIKLNELLFDIFPEMTNEDIRNIKLKDMIPFFFDLFRYVVESFGTEKN